MHDVELEVHADHSDAAPDDETDEPDESDIEIMQSTIKFSDLYSDSSISQMEYDLRNAGYVVDDPDPELAPGSGSGQRHPDGERRERVESDDPHIDGGVLLDPERGN